MTLQEQVCTLEQAKMLKELGCEQGKSVFAWSWIRDNVNNRERFFLVMQPDEFFPAICDAYTVAELGEMLGWLTAQVKCSIDKSTEKWFIDDSTGGFLSFPTEAQARAALLIHILQLKQNNNEQD